MFEHVLLPRWCVLYFETKRVNVSVSPEPYYKQYKAINPTWNTSFIFGLFTIFQFGVVICILKKIKAKILPSMANKLQYINP